MHLPHVKLETGRLTPNGIKVGSEDYDFDLTIMATGFRTLEFMYPIKIYGTNGHCMEDTWKNGARAHLGMTVESPQFRYALRP
jgi:hypothetical protein